MPLNGEGKWEEWRERRGPATIRKHLKKKKWIKKKQTNKQTLRETNSGESGTIRLFLPKMDR